MNQRIQTFVNGETVITAEYENAMQDAVIANSEAIAGKADSAATATALAGKVDKVTGKGLSENDFTDALKTKLDGIEAGANATVIDAAPTENSSNAVSSGGVYAAEAALAGDVRDLDDRYNMDMAEIAYWNPENQFLPIIDGNRLSGAVSIQQYGSSIILNGNTDNISVSVLFFKIDGNLNRTHNSAGYKAFSTDLHLTGGHTYQFRAIQTGGTYAYSGTGIPVDFTLRNSAGTKKFALGLPTTTEKTYTPNVDEDLMMLFEVYKYVTATDLRFTITAQDLTELKNLPTFREIFSKLDGPSAPDTTWLSAERFFGHLFIDTISETATPVIPSESVFEVDATKRLGFRVIEGHMQATSTPGKYIVMHGVNGNLGYELVKTADGSFDPDTAINTLSFTDIRSNYRYRSALTKYQIPVSSAEEWLLAVKNAGMVPFVKCPDAAALALVRSYFGNDFILYDGSRTDHLGPIYVYINTLGTDLSTAKSRIDALITQYGLPLIIGTFQLDYLSQDDLTALVQYTHEKGAFFGTANCYYNAATGRIFKAQQAGVDFASSGWEVPKFSEGNLISAASGADYSAFSTSGIESGGILTLADGQTVEAAAQVSTVALAKAGLEVYFNGTIRVSMGDYWNGTVNYSADGKSLYFSSYFLNNAPTFRITSVGDTTIRQIVFKAAEV